jgi:hypothetical protein
MGEIASKQVGLQCAHSIQCKTRRNGWRTRNSNSISRNWAKTVTKNENHQKKKIGVLSVLSSYLVFPNIFLLGRVEVRGSALDRGSPRRRREKKAINTPEY